MLGKAISKIYSTFLSLLDTPSTYSGQGGKFVKVNPGETGLEFGAGGGTSIDIDFRDYSPAANGQKVSDAGITSGLATLTSATGLFVSGDVGKSCVVTGAGVAGANLHTTIAGYTNSTTITLTANASTTVSGANFSWGTDDTAKIQSAIDDAYAAGSATIQIQPALYYTTGVLTLKKGVELTGSVEGPFTGLVDVCSSVIAPTIMITNSTTGFITCQTNYNMGIADLLFVYPNQVQYSASAPAVYPYTIKIPRVAGDTTGVSIRRCTFANSYNAIDIDSGQTFIEDVFISAFNIGIHIDHATDIVYLNNVHCWPFHFRLQNGTVWPNPIDEWMLANTTSCSLLIHRCDQLVIDNFFSFGTYYGMYITDSLDAALNPRSSYASATNINIDQTRHAIWCNSTQSSGWNITNFMAPGATVVGLEGIAAVTLEAGGLLAPYMMINNISLWGTWTDKFLNYSNGKLFYDNVLTGNPESLKGKTRYNALIDFTGTTHAGIRLNNLTTAQKTALTGLKGMAIYDTTLNKFYGYGGSPAAWSELGGADLASFGIDGGAYSDTYISTANVDAGAY